MEQLRELDEEQNDKKQTSGTGGLKFGIVLSGGGSRAAYQVGALRALWPIMQERGDSISVIVGTSLGAVNGLLLGAGLKHGFGPALDTMESLWRERTFSNTFQGSITHSFIKAIQIAILRFSSPGPAASTISIFDPDPLRQAVEQALTEFGGCHLHDMAEEVTAIGVMTTVEGKRRKPLLFACSKNEITTETLDGATFVLMQVRELTAAHGFASAALPSVLPAVDLDVDTGQVRLIDGGISDNHPVDPAVRLGAENVIMIDSSGRRWWHDHYGEPHYTRPKWEVPAAESTYCMYPKTMISCISQKPLGPLLKEAVGNSRKDFVSALGPTWPVFKILKHKMGEALAYEVMSYVALHPQYTAALIERGYNESRPTLENLRGETVLRTVSD